jgi:hypothetical protein
MKTCAASWDDGLPTPRRITETMTDHADGDEPSPAGLRVTKFVTTVLPR